MVNNFQTEKEPSNVHYITKSLLYQNVTLCGKTANEVGVNWSTYQMDVTCKDCLDLLSNGKQ